VDQCVAQDVRRDIGGKGKNVVRGGYGISYDRMATVYTAGYRENPPLASTAALGLLLGTPGFPYGLGNESAPNFGFPVDPRLQVGLDERNGIKGAKVLIRAIEPTAGFAVMRRRRGSICGSPVRRSTSAAAAGRE